MEKQEHQLPVIQIRNAVWGTFLQAYNKKYQKPYSSLTFTVVSAFGIINYSQNKQHQHKIISVAFGTKSLPFPLTQQHKGHVLKDMHSQILANKAFRKWIIQNLPKQQQHNQYFVWDAKRSKHSLNPNWKVFLYSSQIFCGDCMIFTPEVNLFSGAKPLKSFSSKHYENEDKKYEQNILRTKPGRLDLPLQKRSLSLSCSDKIATWNILGTQGKYLFNLTNPIYLDFIIAEGDFQQGIEQLFKRRLGQGIDFVRRLKNIKGMSQELVIRKLFNIVIDGKERKISEVFRHKKPEIFMVRKQKAQKELSQQGEKEGNQMCGIIFQGRTEWITGRTGIKQGRSLSKYKPGTDTSEFCSSKLYQSIQQRSENFQYTAIKQRIKLLFGIWTDHFKVTSPT